MIKENSNEINNLPSVDVDEILSIGKVVSIEEAMLEMEPIPWDEAVLNGDYVGKPIIKNCYDTPTTLIEEKSQQKIYKR